MIFNIHGGHNRIVPGASGCFSEVEEDRKVKDLVIAKLIALGHTVYDCTDEVGTSQNANLSNIVAKCNSHKVDLDIAIHFNSFNGSAHGTEAYTYDNLGSAYKAACSIVNAISELGFNNRGAKVNPMYYVLRKTVAPAILVECCFCDSPEDARKYNAESMATAIVKGLTGQVVPSSQQSIPTPVVSISQQSIPTPVVSISQQSIPTPVSIKKSVDEIAREVINGRWDNGEKRRQLLTGAGYDYNIVQAKVNEILGHRASVQSAAGYDLLDLVRKTINGRFGNGAARRAALGARYDEVQRQVNLNTHYKTINNPRIY